MQGCFVSFGVKQIDNKREKRGDHRWVVIGGRAWGERARKSLLYLGWPHATVPQVVGSVVFVPQPLTEGGNLPLFTEDTRKEPTNEFLHKTS